MDFLELTEGGSKRLLYAFILFTQVLRYSWSEIMLSKSAVIPSIVVFVKSQENNVLIAELALDRMCVKIRQWLISKI